MKEMDCKQIEKNILFFIDKELSVANNIAFNAHLNNCEHCKLKVENISATYQSFDIVEDKLDDPYFYTRLKQKLENNNTKTPYFVKRILQPASLVSLLLLGIFTGIFIGSQYKSINSTSEEIRNSQIKTYAEENYLTELDNDNYEYLLTTSH